MLFLIIERFKADSLEAIGERFRRCGRMLPDGVEYQASWMAADGSCCYQLMGAASQSNIGLWIDKWIDLVDFDVVEVKTSADYWAERSD